MPVFIRINHNEVLFWKWHLYLRDFITEKENEEKKVTFFPAMALF